jgi:hypothetical protein
MSTPSPETAGNAFPSSPSSLEGRDLAEQRIESGADHLRLGLIALGINPAARHGHAPTGEEIELARAQLEQRQKRAMEPGPDPHAGKWVSRGQSGIYD